MTGPSRVMPPEKEPIDFMKLFYNDVLVELIIEETDKYAKLQKDLHPDENRMAWVRPTGPRDECFLWTLLYDGHRQKTINPNVLVY